MTTPVPAIISPSLLAADFGFLAQACHDIIKAGADTLHVDVMDGHFVPNISFGIPAVSAVQKHTVNFQYPSGVDPKTRAIKIGIFLDCHLMVSNPQQWLPTFADIGVHGFTFHYEALSSEEECIALLKDIQSRGIRSGIALKPKTDVNVITDAIAEVADMILIMTVEPGFGGQKFMADMMPKVKTLRQRYPTKLIQVDGGIDGATISVVAEAGANVIVSGSGIFGASSPADTITSMRQVVQEAAKTWNQ